jgi:hypothetical protein
MVVKSLTSLSVIASWTAIVTAALAQSGGLALETGRLSYSGHYLTQVVMVKNAGVTAYGRIKIECGFFRGTDLVAADDGYIEKLAVGSTGSDNVLTMSDVAADRAQCRIVENR